MDMGNMSPEDEAFDPTTANDEQLTLFLARQGVLPTDLQRSLDRAMERVQYHQKASMKPAFRPWEELELEWLDSHGQ
jgi:hypothetical protein